MLLLDRLDEARFSRYHRMCGEAMSERAVEDISPLPLKAVRHRITRVRELWPGDIEIVERENGVILDRPRFISSIHSGVEAKGGEIDKGNVTGVRKEGDLYRVETKEGSYLTRYLVGADGAFSRVRNDLFEERPKVSVAVKQFILDERPEDDGTITFIYGHRYGGGYRWSFPCGENVNVGYPKGTDEPGGKVLEENGRYIPIGGLECIVRGNACLVGDAAAMANPLSFGGIRVAMLAGRRAAEAIARDDLPRYQKWWSRSKFSNPRFLRAYMQVKDWDDETMRRSTEPFRNGYKALPFIRSMVRMPENINMYMAYYFTFRYGW